MAATTATRALAVDNINPLVKNVRYAVRGKLVLAALELEKQIKEARGKGLPNPHPFNEIVYCNIGNPQQLNQPPITFFRQVLSLVEYPALMENAAVVASGAFPPDAIARARKLLDACGCLGGTGAYSHSKGLPLIRDDVAKFIADRDAVGPCDAESIFLSDGASSAVKLMLNLLIKDSRSGVMIPIPQYPLYSASIAAFGGVQVNYYLEESQTWGLNISELNRSYAEATGKGIEVRCLAVINPSNPTGQFLTRENMEQVVKFCCDKHIALLADEVYQDNVYRDYIHFTSFRKVMKEMGTPWAESLELISFHSVSKGFVGECGKRGGYMQLDNIPKETLAEIYKMASVGLCPNLIGQVMTDLMVMPPQQGEPSYGQYIAEKTKILKSLKARAEMISTALNNLEGYSCQPATGSMYLFPKVALPAAAIAEATRQNEPPDSFYCLALLNATGICVVPGSGFGQVEGTFHFRTTFLPGEDKIQGVIERMTAFHKAFMDKYRS
ncbi:alanine transaminase [Pelomyxa schiedti]|nr:alanine transaminase [Pelomyxa schiedti]KAH3742691.1 alanine transaminase [Pelomyxa schiedti]